MIKTTDDGGVCVDGHGSCIGYLCKVMNMLSKSDMSSLNVFDKGLCRLDNNV